MIQCLTMTNKAATDMFAQILCEYHFAFLRQKLLGVQFAGLYGGY